MGGASSTQDPATGPQSRIFISYRRDDTSGEAHAIRERLVHRYGRDRVFMDTDSIEPGANFVERINEELGSTCIMLVLIGRGWLGRGRRRLLDRADDWVRLEIAVALDHNIPMIPILVDGTPLPASEDLPEPLRPLLTKQTVRLDNSSFEADVAHVEKAVARQVPPSGAEEVDKGAVKRRPARLVLYGAAGVVLATVIVAGILLMRPHPKTVPLLSASSAVLRVKSAELLARDLLVRGFTGHLPPNVSRGAVKLSATPNGLTDPGLVTAIQMTFNGPSNSIEARYRVFQDQGTASRFYYTNSPHLDGYNAVGRLTAVGIGDHTKCEIARQARSSGSSSWGCLSLSGTVVSFSVVLGDNNAGGTGLERQLAFDTIRNLQTVAAATSHKPLGDPPGMTSTMVMTGRDIYDSLVKPFPGALVPAKLTSPQLSQNPFGSGTPPGLVHGKMIQVTFSGSDTLDFISFYVFDTARHAHSWFAQGLSTVDPTGKLNTPTGTDTTPSGFLPSQLTQCGTWSQRAAGGTPAQGVSACYIQWGNVVIGGESDAQSSLTRGDTDLALTMARSAILRVAETIAP